MSKEVQLRVTDLKDMDGEPRMSGRSLGVALGYSDPYHDIRQLVSRNDVEIKRYGNIISRRAETHQGAKSGRPAEELWFNEDQCFAITVLSRTPIAADLRFQIMSVFMAYRRGELVEQPSMFPADVRGIDQETRKVIGGITKSVVIKQVNDILADCMPAMLRDAMDRALEQRFGVLEAGEKIVQGYLTSLEIIRMVGVGERDGSSGGLSAWISNKLVAKCSQAGIQIEWKKSDDGQRLRPQFKAEVVNDWLNGPENGAEEIKRSALRRKNKKAGQHELKFVPEPRKKETNNQ